MMTETQTCQRCGETKPLEDFRETPYSHNNRVSTCRVCFAELTQRGRDRAASVKDPGYIDHDVSAKVEARTPRWYVNRFDLDENDQSIARGAAMRVETYWQWYDQASKAERRAGYDGETAEQYVGRMMKGEPIHRHVHVLQTALAHVINPDDEEEDGTKLSRRAA